MFFLPKLLCLISLFLLSAAWTDIASDSTGKYLAIVGNTVPVSISDDYGATWTQTKSNSYPWTTIYSDPTGKTLVGGTSCTSGSYCPGAWYSNDRGATWTQSSGFSGAGVSPWFYDAIVGDSTGTNLWTVMYVYLYHSANGGKTWYQVSLPYTYGANTGDAVGVDASNKYVYAVSEGYVCYSSNGGSSWTKGMKYAPTDGSWRNFVVDKTGQYVYAVTDYTFYHSTDYGHTWTSVKAYPHYDGKFGQIVTETTGNSAFVIDSGRLYSFTRSTGSYVATSLNATGLVAVAGSTNGQYLYAATSSTIYKSKDSGKTWSVSA